jgi:hypothetical protein
VFSKDPSRSVRISACSAKTFSKRENAPRRPPFSEQACPPFDRAKHHAAQMGNSRTSNSRSGLQSRPLSRRLLNLLTVLSLVLCVALAALWVRSYWVIDRLTVAYAAPVWSSSWQGSNLAPGIGFESMGGRLTFRHEAEYSVDINWHPLGRGRAWNFSPNPAARIVRDLVLKTQQAEHTMARSNGRLAWRSCGLWAVSREPRCWWVSFPHAALVAILALLPAFRATSAMGKRRRAHHAVCTVCGYDLRATPNKCPECGTAPAPTAVWRDHLARHSTALTLCPAACSSS